MINDHLLLYSLKSQSQSALGTKKFSEVIGPLLKDTQVRNFIDILCQATSGLGASEVQAAYMVRAFNQLYQEGCKLEYPIGGGPSIVNALVKGLRKNGGRLILHKTVEKVR